MSFVKINKFKAEKLYNKGQSIFCLPIESEFKIENLVRIKINIGFIGNFDFPTRIIDFEFRFKTKPIFYMKGK
jgi:hypothetical protein